MKEPAYKRIVGHVAFLRAGLECGYVPSVDPETRASPPPGLCAGAAVFATTRWSIVLHARDSASPKAAEALELLCRTYWPPLYAYIRRAGHGVEEARDLTQGFFCALIEKRWLESLAHQDGRFRSFLLTFLKRFLSDHADRARAIKRGGHQTRIDLDEFEAEERERFEPVDQLTPDQAYDRRWLRRLNELAQQRLRDEYQNSGRSALWEAFRQLQHVAGGEDSHGEVARRLGLSPAAVKSALHRLRTRQAALFREVVAETVGDSPSIQEELRDLLRAGAG